METIVVILMLVTLVALIIGLVNPSLIMRWSNKPSRWKVFGWYVLINVVLSILLTISSPNSDSLTSKDEQSKIDNVKNEQNITNMVVKQNTDSIKKDLQERIEIEKKKFNTKYDDFEKITWFYSKTKPNYANTMACYTYIGLKDDGQVWRRLVMRYHGDTWLFVNSMIIKTDENSYNINATNINRDNGTDVWEWIDIPITDQEDIIIDDIISSKQTKIRFIGDQYHHDWTIPSKAIQGLKEINEFYYLLESLSKIDQ